MRSPSTPRALGRDPDRSAADATSPLPNVRAVTGGDEERPAAPRPRGEDDAAEGLVAARGGDASSSSTRRITPAGSLRSPSAVRAGESATALPVGAPEPRPVSQLTPTAAAPFGSRAAPSAANQQHATATATTRPWGGRHRRRGRPTAAESMGSVRKVRHRATAAQRGVARTPAPAHAGATTQPPRAAHQPPLATGRATAPVPRAGPTTTKGAGSDPHRHWPRAAAARARVQKSRAPTKADGQTHGPVRRPAGVLGGGASRASQGRLLWS